MQCNLLQVVETGNVCLSGGYIDLNNSSGPAASSVGGPDNNLGSTALFKILGSQINADTVKKVGAIFQWNITKDGKIAAKWSEWSYHYKNSGTCRY